MPSPRPRSAIHGPNRIDGVPGIPSGIPESEQIIESPTAFISYAYSSEEAEEWVANLAHDLQSKGSIDVNFDKWEVYGGIQQINFMQKIDIADKVVVVCDPDFIEKLNQNTSSGVQFESMLVNKRIMEEGSECSQKTQRSNIHTFGSSRWY